MKVTEIFESLGLEVFKRFGIKGYAILNRVYAVDSFEPAYIKIMLGRGTKKNVVVISPAMDKKDMGKHVLYLEKFFEIDPGPFRTMLSPREGVENDIAIPVRPYPNSTLLESQWKLIASHGTEGHRLFLEDLEAFYKIESREINPDVGIVEAGSELLHFKLRSRWNELYAEIWSVCDMKGDVFIKQTSINTDNRTIRIVLCPGSSCKIARKVRKRQ